MIGYEIYRATISGFGRLEAVDTWSAVSQVQGRLDYAAPGLSVGWVAAEGTQLVSVDERDYEIAKAQAQAALEASVANLAELDVNEQNHLATLEIERNILALAQAELTRFQKLVQQGSVAQPSEDAANRAYLSQTKVVADLEARLALISPQRAASRAALSSSQADLETAQRNLDRTNFVAPFDGRVVAYNTSDAQFVRQGDTLVTLEDTSASEVTGAFQPRELVNLFQSLNVDAALVARLMRSNGDALNAIQALDLDATVRLPSSKPLIEWEAELVRTDGTIDLATGALGLVVQVDAPTRSLANIGRPPLINGSFVEVLLSGQEIEDAILVSREAVRQADDGTNFVYVVDANDRLDRRTIVQGAIVGGRVIIRDGLEPGDIILLSTPNPAIIGMLLAPILDESVAQ